MQLAATRTLYDYWNELRGPAAAPERDAIEPGPIRKILADTFILEFDPGMGHPFRLAGTRVCALFGRELKSQPFMTLWDRESRISLRNLFDVVSGEGVGISAGLVGRTADQRKIDLELMILPLAARGRLNQRVLGALLPTAAPPYWLGLDPVDQLTLGALRFLGESARNSVLRSREAGGIALASRGHPARDLVEVPALSHMPGGRIRRGMIVYDGGKAEVGLEA